jgi:hypothetical protein
MLVTSRQTEDFICAASSTLIFSRSRSVTSRRNRDVVNAGFGKRP